MFKKKTNSTPNQTADTTKLPRIPNEYLIILMFITLCFLRYIDIDTYVTAGISTIIGYTTGKHIERGNKNGRRK